jgi:PAS domain S-box-containing protein
MQKENPSRRELLRRMEELQARLAEAEETLRAIRGGQVDAILVSGAEGEKVFTLEGAEQPYRLFIETLNEGTVTLLADGTIAYCNRRFAEMVRMPLEEVIGSSFWQFLSAQEEPLFQSLLEGAGSKGSKAEFSLLGRDGKLVPAQLSVRPLEENHFRGFCLVVMDLTEQKDAELVRSFLAAIVESSDMAIIGKTLEGTIVTWNRGAERLYGYSAEEVVGRPISILQPPDRTDELRNILDSIRQGEYVEPYDTVRVAKDGRSLDVLLSVSPIRDAAGKLTGASAVARDITARKRAEAALHESQALTAAIVDSTSDLIWSVDPESFGLLTFNRGLSDYFLHRRGIRVQTGLRPEDLLPTPDSAHQWREFYHRVLSEGPFTTDYDAVGSVTLQLTFNLLKRDGELFGISVFGKDISARKRAEAALKESETAFRMLAELVPQLVWMCAPDGLNIYFNQRWVDYTGLSLEESYGRGWNIPFHPDDKQPAWDAWNHAVESGDTYSIECRLRRADGAYHWFLTRGVPLRDATGSIVKWFGTCTDIDGMKRAEEEIRELNASLERRVAELLAVNKELEAFSYSVSHDLRAPLRAIDGFCQALLEDYSDKLDDAARGYLRNARAASQRMDQLVEGILGLTRTSRSQMRRTTVDMSALARTIAQELAQAHPERQVEFVVAPGLVVNADANLLRSVLDNLLGNAWKFTSNHGQARVEVGTIQQDGQTVYFVRDDGAGFNNAYAGQLFGAFQRLHSPTEFEGTGIGLAIVQRIVQRHGGRVWAEGEVEKGATFFFTLPMNPE